MGWYNVVEPCVVGQLHYARPTVQPIELDDEVAAPLVEAGNLTSYPAGEFPESVKRAIADAGGDFADIGEQAAEEFTEGVAAEQPEASRPPARGRRRTEG